MARDDHRVDEAKSKDILDTLEKLGVTGLKGRKPQLAGPCPICGGDDRFWVDTRKNACGCRKCGGGGDPAGAVMFVKGCGFREALDWLCGPEQVITDAERARLDKVAADNKARKDREAAQFRAKAVARAREIWVSGRAAEDGPVRDYLAQRGITRDLLPRLPSCLRFHPDLPYMVQGPADEWVQAHRGPAMLAAIQGADDRFSAVHRTWFDLAAPQGKVRLVNPVTGEPESRKKSWGSKKGGAIRLVRGSTSVLVMGEGIETTLTAAVAGVWPDAHFWAGVDLGNMAGSRVMGKGLKFAGVPDMDDADAFLPPTWVTHLVYVMDGDSDPRTTKAQLLAGLRRAMLVRPGLRAQIAPCPVGKDLNDVLLEGDA
jgi:hypothetical protein